MIDTEGIMKIGLDLANWKKLPFDSTIHIKGRNIKKVLLTIDVTVAELMLAKSIQCDAVIAHHPLGTAALNFHKVFDRHIDYMVEHKVPDDIANDAVKKLKDKVRIRSHANIYNDVIDAAKILKMPLINIHQPCDEYMRKVILEKINSIKIEYVSDIVRSVEEIPEFRNADTRVEVVYGSIKSEVGHWSLVLAAGTNGGFPIAKAYFEHGVSTVIYLHIDYNDLTRMYEEKLKGNLVVLGHLAGDSIGLNALADRLEDKHIEVVRMGIIPTIK
jgi:putative NIF3 family GTP cyclohydrolase 1 type 2